MLNEKAQLFVESSTLSQWRRWGRTKGWGWKTIDSHALLTVSRTVLCLLFSTDKCQQKEITAFSPEMRRNQRLEVEEDRLPRSIDRIDHSASYRDRCALYQDQIYSTISYFPVIGAKRRRSQLSLLRWGGTKGWGWKKINYNALLTISIAALRIEIAALCIEIRYIQQSAISQW